jgi:WD40 repeat protein
MPDSRHVLTGGAQDGSWGMWRVPEGSAVFFKDQAYFGWVVDIAYDAERQRIFTSGGVDDQPLKTWDLRGNLIRQWELGSANQANWVSVSSDCSYIVVSHADRHGSNWALGISLFRCLPDGELTLVRNLAWQNWYVFMLHKTARYFALNRQGYVAIYDPDKPKRVRRFNIKGWPTCCSHSDELLAVQKHGPEGPDGELQVWHIGGNAHLTTVRFGPQNRLLRGDGEFHFRRCDACFAPDDSVLIGGSDDGTYDSGM